MFTVGPSPVKLSLTAAPDTIAADGFAASLIAVQLQGRNGEPVRAPQDIEVTLSSSNLTVGRIAASVTITAGRHYALAYFNSSGTAAGSANVTASASGVESDVQLVKTRAVASTATSLQLAFVPESVLPDRAEYPGLVAFLVNATGFPARAATNLPVSLASSNTDVGTVNATAILLGGRTSVIATFNSTLQVGQTQVTASASGLINSTQVVRSIGPVPQRIVVIAAPARLEATAGSSDSVFVQLQDDDGNPANAPQETVIELSSNAPSFVDVGATLVIRAGSTFAVASVTTTTTAGGAVVSASAPGYASGAVTVNTTEVEPSRLALFGLPPILQATGESVDSLVVQLQNAAGVPANARRDIELFLTSSANDVGSPAGDATLSAGRSFVSVSFVSTARPGTTTIAVAASGHSNGTLQVRTVTFPLTVVLNSTLRTLTVGDRATLTVQATSLGEPISDAEVDWTTTQGTLTVSQRLTGPTGESQVAFSSETAGNALVRVEARRAGFELVSPANITITVLALPAPLQPTASPFGQALFWVGLAGGAVLVVGVVVIIIRRRRAQPELFL
jgi:adhesin/invasin